MENGLRAGITDASNDFKYSGVALYAKWALSFTSRVIVGSSEINNDIYSRSFSSAGRFLWNFSKFLPSRGEFDFTKTMLLRKFRPLRNFRNNFNGNSAERFDGIRKSSADGSRIDSRGGFKLAWDLFRVRTTRRREIIKLRKDAFNGKHVWQGYDSGESQINKNF